MNAIICTSCHDVLVPIVPAGVQTCFCGAVKIRAVDECEHLSHLVEVKIINTEWMPKVLKINNRLLNGFDENSCDFESGDYSIPEYQRTLSYKNNLFRQYKSHVVLTGLDTPGVKVVQNFTRPPLSVWWWVLCQKIKYALIRTGAV